MRGVLHSFLKPVSESHLLINQKAQNLRQAIFFILKGYGLLVLFMLLDLFQHQFSKHYLIIDAFKTHRGFASKTTVEFFTWIVIIAPITEEMTFRSFMDRRRFTVSLSAGLLFFVLLRILNLFSFAFHWYAELAVGLCLVVVFYFTLPSTFFKLVNKNFKVIFFTMNILFVTIHVTNYDLSSFSFINFIFLPIILLPQALLSVGCSFVRLKNGLGWAVALHILNNSLPWLVMVFFKHQ